MLVNCKNCDKVFEKSPTQIRKSPNHFCCQSCAAKFNNLGRIKNKPKERICRRCKAKYYKTKKSRATTKMCEKCFAAYLNLDDYHRRLTLANCFSDPSVIDKHPSWKAAYIRNLNRKWNKDKLSKPCAGCGYSKHVELAHIRAISSFPLNEMLGVVNHSSNVIQLCPNCHWEFDHGLLVLATPEGFEPTLSNYSY